jgi:quinol monooxygenase YgiN
VPIVLVATMIPKPEHRDEVIAAVTEAVGKVHAEDGCELYSLHQAPDRLVIIEKWASPEALAAHRTAPALAALGPALAGKMAGRTEVVVLEPVPAGDPAKGQV